MKRYGEKATREALTNGATIRFYDWYTLSGGYRVMVDGEAVGYITCDLFYKLHQDGTIKKTCGGYCYSEYSAAQVEEPAQDDAPDAVDPLEEAQPAWRDYLVTICDTTSAEERRETVSAINEEHARRIGWSLCRDLERVECIQDAAHPVRKPGSMRKHYINSRTGEDTNSARQAMAWHRAGDDIQVNTFYNEPHKTGLANVVHVRAARVEIDYREDENRAHCRHIAEQAEAYAAGDVFRCPDCGQDIRLPDDVGDKYRCPCCGAVNDVDDLEQLSMWDYMSDILDVEYRCGSDREYRSCKICVAWGGPNIYIDTASALVKLYWWTEYAEYPLSYDARDAVDEWAEEYWNI